MTYNVPIFVVHVKSAEARRKHMESQLAKHGMDNVQWLLDGDIEDLSPERLSDFFADGMTEPKAASSCGFKHIQAYKAIVEQGIERALVFEDDIFLSPKFNPCFRRACAESEGIEVPFLVGFESTCMRFIPRSQRKRGQTLYRADALQCAGAYMVNRAFAQAVLAYLHHHRCAKPFDWYLSGAAQQGVFDIYWAYPVVAEQGSHNGAMSSMIGNAVGAGTLWIRARRYVTKKYKQLIYFFR